MLIGNQTKYNYDACLDLFKESNYKTACNILNNVSFMSAIMINLKIINELPTLIEESNTLSLTFLPYLSSCINFDFIPEGYIRLCSRIVH